MRTERKEHIEFITRSMWTSYALDIHKYSLQKPHAISNDRATYASFRLAVEGSLIVIAVHLCIKSFKVICKSEQQQQVRMSRESKQSLSQTTIRLNFIFVFLFCCVCVIIPHRHPQCQTAVFVHMFNCLTIFRDMTHEVKDN